MHRLQPLLLFCDCRLLDGELLLERPVVICQKLHGAVDDPRLIRRAGEEDSGEVRTQKPRCGAGAKVGSISEHATKKPPLLEAEAD